MYFLWSAQLKFYHSKALHFNVGHRTSPTFLRFSVSVYMKRAS